MTHICASKLTIIGSDNGLSPGRRQAIIWTNAGILLIGPRGTNFSEMLIEIYTFSFKKMYFKMSSGQWRPFCLGLNVLSISNVTYWWPHKHAFSPRNPTRGHFYKHSLTLISAWIRNHMHSKVWDEITYRFPNLGGCTVEVWEWISNLITLFIMDLITLPCWN